MVIDDYITVVGTFNFDPRSANYNTECVSVIYSNEIAKGVKKHMEQEFQSDNAWETTATSNPDWKSSETKRIQTKIRRVVPKGIL
jgi:phosphatidylserine/phosphatidylglycerophosphate/cardiolipin synthase-like enzyme